MARLDRGSHAERVAALEAIARRPGDLDLPRLRLLLSDSSPAIRALALSIAAARAEPQIVDWVGERVDDPDPRVRRAALEALLRFESPARDPYLVAAYPLHGLEARAAIVAAFGEDAEKLRRLIEEEARAIWERNAAALESGGVAEFVGALELLGRSGREEAVERLIALLHGQSTRVVVAAARALALSQGGARAREALEGLLESEIPERRMAAIEALERLDDPAAAKALRAAADREGEEAMAAAQAYLRFEPAGSEACEAARAAQNPVAARLLARYARGRGVSCEPEKETDEEPVAAAETRSDESPPAATRLAEGPASANPADENSSADDPASVGPAAENAAAETAEVGAGEDRSTESPVRPSRAAELRAVLAAGDFDDPEPLLALAAQDLSGEARRTTLEALARVEDEEVVERLATLAVEGGEIGRLAVEALERRGDAERLLRIFRQSGSPRAAEALARLGRAEAARALLEPGADGVVTPEWLLALAALDGEVAGEAARLHLAHDRPEIRAAAARVLAPRCDFRAMPLLRALAAADYHVQVRQAAREAVETIRQCRP